MEQNSLWEQSKLFENLVTYVLTTTRINPTGHRWLNALSPCDFNIQCKLGHENIYADLLSRDLQRPEDDWVKIQFSPQITPPDLLTISPDAIPAVYTYLTQTDVSPLAQLSHIAIPSQSRPMVLKSMHENTGHFVLDQNKELIKDWFYCPKMATEFTMYTQNYARCIAGKALLQEPNLYNRSQALTL